MAPLENTKDQLDDFEFSQMGVRTWNLRSKTHYLAGIFLIVLVTAAIYNLAGNNGGIPLEQAAQQIDREIANATREEESVIAHNDNNTTTVSRCDMFKGRWVFDNISFPMYKERDCSFMIEDHACEKYGRKDLKYQQWRWQPQDCDLPRFNGTAFLEKIRGKKLVFVGDSLNRNQYISMLCLIESSLSSSVNKSAIRNGNYFGFNAVDYNASIGFYWSPFLVESNNDDPFIHRLQDRVVRIKSIENHGRHWINADILIFDSFIWWLEPTMTILWGSFGSDDAIYKRVDTREETRYRVYEIGLNTWLDWLEFNINTTKTKLFFMSLSPSHRLGESWGEVKNCYNTSEPISKEDYWGIMSDRRMMRVVESAIEKLESRGIKIQYLNITQMSDYRKDGHPSIYRKFFHSMSEEQLKDPTSYSDCHHWCLPGVPDYWNQVLYAHIMNS
ncbi:protein trichome birefringence-like 34 [Primulina huaijiensis]|uniref:protein trichome birefringence-like 34 n=1 Tax=Primulina huaijiensis TaxID=1492673 RepID=UPI003CC7931F